MLGVFQSHCQRLFRVHMASVVKSGTPDIVMRCRICQIQEDTACTDGVQKVFLRVERRLIPVCAELRQPFRPSIVCADQFEIGARRKGPHVQISDKTCANDANIDHMRVLQVPLVSNMARLGKSLNALSFGDGRRGDCPCQTIA